MPIKTLILLLILIITIPAFGADPWSKQDIALEATWQALHLVDWGQAAVIARNPDRYHELNPILGRHPSTQTVHAYMAGSAILHIGITHILPSKWRPYFQGITIGFSGICVLNNFNIGLAVKF